MMSIALLNLKAIYFFCFWSDSLPKIELQIVGFLLLVFLVDFVVVLFCLYIYFIAVVCYCNEFKTSKSETETLDQTNCYKIIP